VLYVFSTKNVYYIQIKYGYIIYKEAVEVNNATAEGKMAGGQEVKTGRQQQRQLCFFLPSWHPAILPSAVPKIACKINDYCFRSC
jgi:hypothetical protein